MGSKKRNTRRVVEGMKLDVHGTEHLETSVFGRESHEERSASTVPPPPPAPAGIWKEVVEESSSDTPNPPESEDSLAHQSSL